MRNATVRSIHVFALVLAAACGQDDPAAPRTLAAGRPTLSGPVATGFSWLPPMVKDLGAHTGAFDGSRSPVVRVLCAGATSPRCPEVARFDGTSAGSAKVTVDLLEEAYKTNWHTPETLELGSGKYRLEVSENGGVLGLADLLVVQTQRDANAVPAGEIALVRGQPFLIKFRIEVGADPDPLPVPATTPIRQAIPDLVFVPQAAEYQTGHPDMPGKLLSPSVLTVSLQGAATAGEVNTLLRPLGVRVVGGMPSAAPEVGGFLILRLPTSTHAEMEAALAILRASPRVRAAFQNHPLDDGVLPLRSSFTGNWDWNVAPQGGNWALEVARVPQLWAFNDRVAASARHTTVLVFDRAFWPSHEDLTFASILLPDSMVVFPGLAADDYHGTIVASVLQAGFGNGKGLDGVDPFARLYSAHRVTDASEELRQLRDILLGYPSVRVVNQSFGIDWTDASGNLTATRVAIPALAWTASRGAISGTGLFTAPVTDGPVTITATSQADPAVQATAIATVQAFGGLIVSPTVAATGFGQTRVFSVVAGAGPFTWVTDAQGGTINGGVFSAGTTEGEFFIGVSSPTGSGSARVIVDRWAGNYAGTVSRNGVQYSRSWSIGRYSVPPMDQRCGRNDVPCYFTGSIDLGSAAITACYFHAVSPGSIDVNGYCDYSASAFSLSLVGTISLDQAALTLRDGNNTVLIVIGMTKQ
jgi:hypothetical protein